MFFIKRMGVCLMVVSCVFSTNIIVKHRNNKWYATVNGKSYRCAVGRSGVCSPKVKKEMDGCTPAGTYSFHKTLYVRSDVDYELFKKIEESKKNTKAPFFHVRKSTDYDGWGVDTKDPKNYNRYVDRRTLKTGMVAGKMIRPDDLFDMVLVIKYNTDPKPIVGKGSAIYLHIARLEEHKELYPTYKRGYDEDGYGTSEGCVAFSRKDLLEIIPLLDQKSTIEIHENKS